MTRLYTCLLLSLTISLVCEGSEPVAVEHFAERTEAWRAYFDRGRFFFLPEESGVIPSLSRYKAKAPLHLVYDSEKPGRLRFEILQAGKPILGVSGHVHSSFASGDGLFVFARFEPDSAGCTVAAYEIATGEMIWETELQGARPAGASAYRNQVQLRVNAKPLPNIESDDQWRSAAVIVIASETYCDYFEALDLRTGTSLGIKKYRVGFEKQKK